MSERQQLALAALAWLTGFVALRRLGTVVPLLAMAVALSATLVAREPSTRDLLRLRPRAIILGLLAGAAQIAATYLLYPLCVRAWPPLTAEVRGLQALLFHGLPRLAVGTLVAAISICEEILFRGRLVGSSRTRVLLSAIFYAAVHATSGSAVLVALAFACGLYWGTLRAAGCSLWASIPCHVGWDLAIMVVAPL